MYNFVKTNYVHEIKNILFKKINHVLVLTHSMYVDITLSYPYFDCLTMYI